MNFVLAISTLCIIHQQNILSEIGPFLPIFFAFSTLCMKLSSKQTQMNNLNPASFLSQSVIFTLGINKQLEKTNRKLHKLCCANERFVYQHNSNIH